MIKIRKKDSVIKMESRTELYASNNAPTRSSRNARLYKRERSDKVGY